MQLQVLTNFLKDFQEDEKLLLASENEDVSAEKLRDIEKREKEEWKRIEKMIIKKDQVDVEEAYGNTNVKLLRDRIQKSITEGVLKQQKLLAKA